MRNQKQQLREDNRERKNKLKQLRGLPKNSEEAISLRKELGIASLADILGDRYPIRVCKHCGKRAYNIADLTDFIFNKRSKHQHREVCVACSTYSNPEVIVGEHILLPKVHTCIHCGRKELLGTIHSFFYKRATVCKVCYGSHKETFGKPEPIPRQLRPLTEIHHLGAIHLGIAEASRATGVPIDKIRNSLLGIIEGAFKLRNTDGS